jgi:hypothetical protein
MVTNMVTVINAAVSAIKTLTENYVKRRELATFL